MAFDLLITIEKLANARNTLFPLDENPRNSRRHSQRQIRQIARSIESFGFNVPILIDKESTILSGHGRVEAAKFLRLEEVPVISIEHLTETQAKAFSIADNRLTEISVWNDQLLASSVQHRAA